MSFIVALMASGARKQFSKEEYRHIMYWRQRRPEQEVFEAFESSLHQSSEGR